MWVIMMKKNDYYFFIIEWIKDNLEFCGWWWVIYEGKDVIEGEVMDGVLIVVEEIDVGVGGDVEEVIWVKKERERESYERVKGWY